MRWLGGSTHERPNCQFRYYAAVERPLVVDVDGTLVVTDLLHEAVLQFIARHPFQSFRIFGWLMAGKSNLKTQLADRVTPGMETVPLRQEVCR